MEKRKSKRFLNDMKGTDEHIIGFFFFWGWMYSCVDMNVWLWFPLQLEPSLVSYMLICLGQTMKTFFSVRHDKILRYRGISNVTIMMMTVHTGRHTIFFCCLKLWRSRHFWHFSSVHRTLHRILIMKKFSSLCLIVVALLLPFLPFRPSSSSAFAHSKSSSLWLHSLACFFFTLLKNDDDEELKEEKWFTDSESFGKMGRRG